MTMKKTVHIEVPESDPGITSLQIPTNVTNSLISGRNSLPIPSNDTNHLIGGRKLSRIYARHIGLPAPHSNAENSGLGKDHLDITCAPFNISLLSVDGIIIPGNRSATEYQLLVSLYDVAYKQFFGRQWTGPLVSAPAKAGQKPRLQYNQNVYFHTSIKDMNVLVVVEIVAMTMDQNGTKSRISCGWGILRVFKYDGEMPDTGKSGSAKVYKMEIYHGSPRALYYLDDPTEGNQNLRPSGCHLTYNVRTHRALLKILHLLPENVIIGTNDIIPGLVDAQSGDPTNNDRTDCLKKPKSLDSIPCQIDRLTVTLPPSVDKFEEELCQYLNEDRMARENRTADGTSVSILERRMQIGVHNGWSFVEKPQTVHLDPEMGTGGTLRKVGMSPTMRRSTKFGKRPTSATSVGTTGTVSALVVRNSIHINELLEDPLFALVFTLEYVIGEPLSSDDRKMTHSLMRAQSRTISIRWGAWNPFMGHNSSEIHVGLIGGTTVNPNDSFVYKVPPTDMQDKNAAQMAPGLVSFIWTDLRNEGMAIPNFLSTGHMMMGSQQSMPDDGAMMDTGRTKPPIPGQRPSPQIPEIMEPQMMITSTPYQNASPRSVHQSPHSVHQSPHSVHQSPHATLQHSPQGLNMSQLGQSQHSAHQSPHMGSHSPHMASHSPHSMAYSPHRSPGVSLSQQALSPYLQGQVDPANFPGSPMAQGMGEHHMDMNELAYTPVHAPIMLTQPSMNVAGLSRSAYARLYSAGFQPILDRNHEAPEVVNPQQPLFIDVEKEIADPLLSNEVMFQFLAFSKMLDTSSSSPSQQHDTVFFTFQFYRYPQVTTERLLLAKPQAELSGDTNSMPFILQRLDKDGSLLKATPGYDVKYFVDPEFLKAGERPLFLQHLSRQVMHIDVWDGDSLLLIGSCSVELKYLCRHGNEATQTTFELDVLTTEYEESSAITTPRNSVTQPMGVTTLVKGRLHLRIANIGHPSEAKSEKPGTMLSLKKSHVILSQTTTQAQQPGGSMLSASKTASLNMSKVSRAHNLVQDNQEVASMLVSKRVEKKKPVEEVKREGDSAKARKLARMAALRQAKGENADNKANIMGKKVESQERTRDLKTIEFYRTQTKRDGILSMLSQAIDTEHTICPSFGTAEFFEFVLKNPYNVQQTITVECSDPELSVLSDAREWQHYKTLLSLDTPIEERMFSKNPATDNPQVFLRPKETINLPLKFQMFRADHSVRPQGPLDVFNKQPPVDSNKNADTLSSYVTKVIFRSEDGKQLAILSLKVEPQPHVIDQTFRFHHPEQAFLKKSIRLPPFHSLPGAPIGGTGDNRVFIRCSDSNVICDSKITQPGEPQDVFLKVALGASPQIKKFCVCIYTDKYLSRPAQIWQFFVHALQRVDVACVEGQMSKFSLILRGTQASRLARCYSSHPGELHLEPKEPFLLAASTVHELTVSVCAQKTGNKFFYINVVDTEYHQLLRTWLVCANCRAPIISRAFELMIPISGGRGCNKRISFTNPYPYKKTFLLKSNREDLVQFKDSRLDMASQEKLNIGLRFTPTTQSGTLEILIFINDEEGKNEETFCIKAKYVQKE